MWQTDRQTEQVWFFCDFIYKTFREAKKHFDGLSPQGGRGFPPTFMIYAIIGMIKKHNPHYVEEGGGGGFRWINSYLFS